jgi:hypothetical protein
LLWSFAPHHGWRFQSNDAALRLPRSHRSHLLRTHRARYSTGDWCFSWRQSAQQAGAPGHPSWGLPPDGVHPRLHSPQNRHRIDGRSMHPPPAATQSPLPSHSRIPRLQPWARSGPRHGTINLVGEAPLMFPSSRLACCSRCIRSRSSRIRDDRRLCM